MEELQLYFSGIMASLVALLPIGYAFGAGMMASVNPCGFPMLPLYLSLYMGTHEEDFMQKSSARRLLHAMGVAAVVSSGFVVLFGLVGLLVMMGARVLTEVIPFVAVAIGFFLLLLGFWMLAGKHVSPGWFMRISERIGDPKQAGLRGFFLYGLAYAVCSLSCTLPIFLVVVGSAATAGSLVVGIAQFISYAAGMGSVIFTLTASMALFKEGVMVAGMRRLFPYIHVASAVLVLLAGGYLVYYWLLRPEAGLLGL